MLYITLTLLTRCVAATASLSSPLLDLKRVDTPEFS